MSIRDLKFNAADFSGKDISSLPDRPGDSGITGQQLKERFDQIPKIMVAMGGFNDLIDELNGANGAENIGISPIEGVSGNTAQAALVEMGALTKAARTAAETAAQQGAAAQQAAENANAAADEATEKAAEAARAASAAAEQGNEAAAAAVAATAAVIEVKDYAAEQAQSAKDYVDQVILAGGAVTSVFGRAGEVKAQAGDYTADMVGARPNTWTPTAAEIGAASSIHASQHASSGTDPITPESIGAVSKTGDTMTGNFNIQKNTPAVLLKNTDTNREAALYTSSNSVSLEFREAIEDKQNYRRLYIAGQQAEELANAVNLVECVDGVVKYKVLYGSHNDLVVKKSGDTMTGELTIERNSSSYFTNRNLLSGRESYYGASDDGTCIIANSIISDSNNRTALWVGPNTKSVADLFRINNKVNGASNTYQIHHTGNKPTFYYTGNGSATTRTIPINGISNLIVIKCKHGAVIGTRSGFFGKRSSEVVALHSTHGWFSGNTITLTSTNDLLNENGTEYTVDCI